MQLKDTTGKNLKPGDQVLFALGLGQMSIATIAQTTSGLEPSNPQAGAHVVFNIFIPAAPSGLVNLVKVADAPEQKSSLET